MGTLTVGGPAFFKESEEEKGGHAERRWDGLTTSAGYAGLVLRRLTELARSFIYLSFLSWEAFQCAALFTPVHFHDCPTEISQADILVLDTLLDTATPHLGIVDHLCVCLAGARVIACQCYHKSRNERIKTPAIK